MKLNDLDKVMVLRRELNSLRDKLMMGRRPNGNYTTTLSLAFVSGSRIDVTLTLAESTRRNLWSLVEDVLLEREKKILDQLVSLGVTD